MLERDCYPGVIGFFNERLVPRFRPRFGFHAFWTIDTSLSSGDDESIWSRPDVTSIVIGRGKYAPQSQLTLITGEVKLRADADLRAVHQALAQSRYAHCAYLICQVDKTRQDRITKDLALQCERLGLGFATFIDPSELSTYETHVHAARKEPDVDDLDHFIETRIDERHQDMLRACLAPDWAFQ